jgi:GntR family transcriptional regulator
MAADDRPVYIRLRETIADAILDGVYRDGDPLPSVRAMASDSGANPLTVAKAYQGLQDEQIVAVRRGVGMFVAPGAADRLRRHARAEFLAVEWPRIRERMERLDIPLAELLEDADGG